MPCTLGSCDIICLVLALCVWTCGCDCVWMCGDVFVWVWYVCVCVMCSSVVLVLLPGHFFNRAAGVGLSKAVWCPVSVLCSNVELVLLPGHF